MQTLQGETRLTIAMDLTSPTQYVRTQRVVDWRRTQLPDLQRRPAIFIIG